MNDREVVTYTDICIDMLSRLWYPVIYFKINFGKQDQFARLILGIKEHYQLNDNIYPSDLIEFLREHHDDRIIQDAVKVIFRFVPYRFLRPWFPELSGVKDGLINGMISINQHTKAVPYIIDQAQQQIILRKDPWIMENMAYVEAFTLNKLYQYLSKRNPNVPGVINKLIKPEHRRLGTQTKYWKGFIDAHPHTKSVFEQTDLQALPDLSIDHFVPWSFTTHDQLWNLHPVSRRVNSSKGNRLPTNDYLMPFIDLQYDFMQHLLEQSSAKKMLEDYYHAFDVSREELMMMEHDGFQRMLKKQINPMLEVASNMGFGSGWEI